MINFILVLVKWINFNINKAKSNDVVYLEISTEKCVLILKGNPPK